MRGPRHDAVDCDRPLLAVVSDAGEPLRQEIWRCSNHRKSRCVPCSGRYRRRVESVAAEGLYRSSGFFYFLTLTAPSDVGQHCKRRGCSDGETCGHEKCRCTSRGGVDLGEWNPTAAKRWNHLLVSLERTYAVRPRYFRAVEVQDGHRSAEGTPGRGALHVHALVWSPRKWSERTLRRLAIDAGFGHSVDLKPIEPGSRKAAVYVSKYVTKSCDSRDDVPWAAPLVDPATGETRMVDAPATFRTWSQSATWGTSLAQLRARDLERYRAQELERLVVEQAEALIAAYNAAPATGIPEPDA